MKLKKERKGEILAFISAGIWGIFPILVNHETKNIPPIMFAGIATIIASLFFFVYALFKGKMYELKNKKVYFHLLMITICVVVVPQTLFFLGSSKTSGINSSLLLLSEIIFMLLFTPIIGEKTTAKKVFGAVGVLIGAILILYNGSFSINFGDLLIIFSTITYPLGNFYTKKALNYISPAIILLVRSFIGGIFILFISILAETQSNIVEIVYKNLGIILFTGFILLGIGKIIWYEALKCLDISKAISISSTFPLFSLIILIVFFQEIPSIYQGIGILIITIGVYFSIKRLSTEQSLTKYAS